MWRVLCRPYGPWSYWGYILFPALTGGAIRCRPAGPSPEPHRLQSWSSLRECGSPAGLPEGDGGLGVGRRRGAAPKGPGIAGRNARVTQTRRHYSPIARSRSPDALLRRLPCSPASAGPFRPIRHPRQSRNALRAGKSPAVQRGFFRNAGGGGWDPSEWSFRRTRSAQRGFCGNAACRGRPTPWGRPRTNTDRRCGTAPVTCLQCRTGGAGRPGPGGAWRSGGSWAGEARRRSCRPWQGRP